MPVYSKWIGTIIDHNGLKYICFNHMVTTYILTSMVMFLMTLINITSSPRLASIAMSALVSLFVLMLSIKFAYQVAHGFKTQFELH